MTPFVCMLYVFKDLCVARCIHASESGNCTSRGIGTDVTCQLVTRRLKDRVPLQQKAGVVYRIPCSGCPRVNVGQTGRTLVQRLKEHNWALVNGHLAQSAVAEHAAQE